MNQKVDIYQTKIDPKVLEKILLTKHLTRVGGLPYIYILVKTLNQGAQEFISIYDSANDRTSVGQVLAHMDEVLNWCFDCYDAWKKEDLHLVTTASDIKKFGELGELLDLTRNELRARVSKKNKTGVIGIAGLSYIVDFVRLLNQSVHEIVRFFQEEQGQIQPLNLVLRHLDDSLDWVLDCYERWKKEWVKLDATSTEIRKLGELGELLESTQRAVRGNQINTNFI